jgi:hypothetical protein
MRSGILAHSGVVKSRGPYLTSDALKIEPNRMCPSAFITTFWQFLDFILQISHDKTFKIRYTRCLFIVI